MIANSVVDSKGMFEGEISNRDQYDVEADDDECADGDVDDNRGFETIEGLTTI
jgi:hypothetical protein